MIYVVAFLAGWAIGAILTGLFVAGASRLPTPEPFRPLDKLQDLARHA